MFFSSRTNFFKKSKCFNYVLSNPPVASQSTGSLTNHAVPRSLNKIWVKYSNYQKQMSLIMIAAKGFDFFSWECFLRATLLCKCWTNPKISKIYRGAVGIYPTPLLVHPLIENGRCSIFIP